MILFTAAAIKILVFILTLVVCYRIFSKRLDKKQLIFFSILVMIFACCANYISNLLPPLTDTITLTALGEKQEEAKGTEVYLNGYTIDGEEYLAGKSLEVESGHWFWSGETYAWRPETDSRQPAGVSRKVVLNIPAGWDRTLNFSSNEWRGLVQIDDGYNVWVEDTYAEKGSVRTVDIGQSKTALLIINQLQYLFLYVVILLIMSMCTAWITIRVLRNPNKAKEWLDKNVGKLVYAGISVFTFCLMFHYAARASFWYDELYEVAFTKGSLKDALMHCLHMSCDNPPLAVMLETLWYSIAPYGEKWLLLISIISVCISIFIMGVICEKILDKYCGILAAILMAMSTTVWNNAAYEYRSYAWMIVFSTLTWFYYFKRNECSGQNKYIIMFGICMICLSMSHYFGVLACACFFCGDIYLFVKRKINIKVFISYCLLAVIFLIWFVSVLLYKREGFLPTWHTAPGVTAIKTLLYFVSGNYKLTFLLFVWGMATAISLFLGKKTYKLGWINYYCLLSLCSIVFTVSMLFLYGNFINPNGSLWKERYFCFLIPHVCLLSTLIILCIKSDYIKKALCLFFAIVLTLNCLGVISTSKSSEPFREAADWIYTQSNYIFNADTLIISNAVALVKDGWNEYYITRQGRRDDIGIVTQYEINAEQILEYNRIYVQYSHSATLSNLQSVLDDNYNLLIDNKNIKVKVYSRK